MSIVRNFNLYLNAGNGSAPYINVNQYDQGEQWVFTLYKEDGTKYTPSTGAIVGIKADNRGIINAGTVDADGRVVINETQQMTAAAGIAIFELLIDGDSHGTANFLVNVERRPGDNADLSDSDLSLIQEAIDSAAEIEDLLDGQDVPTVITPIITDWLDDNITNPSNPPIDTSLTVAGAAADAKATGDEITDLKIALQSELSEITKTVTSANIFNQLAITTTDGKYLNPNTGNVGTNESYSYTNEYTPIKASTTYRGTVWKKSDLSKNGYFNLMICYYNANKEFISGESIANNDLGIITTPANTAYFRFSLATTSWANNYYMFTEGTSDPSTYEAYRHELVVKLPYTIVDINGYGDYKSINEAVQNIDDGGTIIVMPGIYNENVEAWNKEVHIIGVDKQTCVLTDASGNYSTPPLEIDHGSIENMSIIEKHVNATITDNMTAYAIHVEGHGLYNSELLIKDCYIYSNTSAAIGMGLRGGCKVTIENCELVTEDLTVSPSQWGGPLYFHDADSPNYRGTANLYVRNCYVRNLSSKPGVISINSIHSDNTTYLHYLQNGFFCTGTPKFNCWNTAGNTSADGWQGLSKMYLSDDSFGNNLTEMNY